MECYQAQRHYLIKLESGLIIRRNRIHLRKRLTPCATEHHNCSFSGTGLGDEEDGPRRTRQAFNQSHDEQEEPPLEGQEECLGAPAVLMTL